MTKVTAMPWVLAFWLALFSMTAAAEQPGGQGDVNVSIEPQPMEQALTTFASQTGLQLLFNVKELIAPGLVSRKVQGVLPAEEALRRLLGDSGLQYQFINPRTVRIAPAGRTSATRLESVPLRMAQAERVDAARPVNESAAGTAATEAGSPVLEEILVTAQKRVERLIDVPISIVALTADELDNREIKGIDDLALAVPGLSIVSNGQTRTIALRGVSNTFGSSSLIGLYLDETSATSSPLYQLDLRTYDLERVEVLRGPQGTLYGEGSVGGTIRFITKDPLLDRFEMNTSLAALFTEEGDAGGRLEGAVSVPLIENELGLRIAGVVDEAGGWIDQPAANRGDFNDQSLTDVRIKGLWKISQQLTMSAMVVAHDNDAPPGMGEDRDGNFTQVFALAATPGMKDDYELYNLTLNYDFSSVRVLSATSYIDQNKELRNLGKTVPLLPPPLPGIDLLTSPSSVNAKIFTQELRLSSLETRPLQWTLGAFYRSLEDEEDTTFSVAPAVPLAIVQDRDESKSWAAFGDASYRLTDGFTLGAGLRYFSDERENENLISGVRQTASFHALSPRIYAQYQWSENLSSYASVAKGFRSGGFNAASQPEYDPETVWTYELGTKAVLLGNRAALNVALFYSDYTDYQIVGLLPDNLAAGNITSNAGDAHIRGVEGSLSWHPTPAWTLGLNGNYVDSEFYEIDAVFSSHAVGDSLDQFPDYGYTVSAQRDFQWLGRAGFARVDYNEQGPMTTRNRGVGPWYFAASDVINMLNLNVGLRWSPHVSLGLFAQNLLNDRGLVNPYSVENTAVRSRPRTYGIELHAVF